MKAFGQLVTIKKYREEEAERTVVAQKRRVVEATDLRDEAGQRLEQYRDYAETQETLIYRKLCERLVRLRDIEDAHGEVRTMRQQERDHEDDLEKAEEKRMDEEQQLDTDRGMHREARRKRDKFIEMADIFAKDARAAADRKEEAEIEEAAETRRPERIE